MGVAIVLKRDLNISISIALKDNEGRILSLNILIERQNYLIINIFAPTRISEKSKFYQHVKNYIEPKQNLILGGDFNTLRTFLLDRKGGNPNHMHISGFDH